MKKNETAQREEEILGFWRENNIFEKTLEKTKNGEPFIFYNGPPFATGMPHYGHLLQGTVQDTIPRYQTMKGRYVRRKWGWDCHGLPIENLIEQELKLKNKQDIEDYGIEKFNQAACDSVMRYDKEWKEIVPKMGRFVDMENSYKTMDWQYSESIWWAFKTLYDKKLIYKGYKSMHVCPRCETTLSNNEVAEGYKDIKDISVTAKFELVDEPGTFVLAWTTTPWTLPGNAALAVGENIDYIKAKIRDQKSKDEYIIIAAKELAEKVLEGLEYEIVGELKGKDLIGRSYKPIFDYYAKDKTLENHENGWKIYGADFVTTEDGTGVVHIAPAFGEDDMNLGKENDLPFVQHVKMNGQFKDEVTDFAGMQVKPKSDDEKTRLEADIAVLKYLQEHETYFAKLKIEHSYPYCWRCKTPLLNYATDSWFVNVGKLKAKMIEENKTINWIPGFIGSGRFGNWLEGARDWAISRSRYWGAPFPVWECKKCGMTEVVGSIEELTKKLPKSGNTYTVIRHGQSDSNVKGYISCDPENGDHLTDLGKKQSKETAEKLKEEKFDMIIASSFVRTKETAEIIADTVGIDKKEIIYDKRIWEIQAGDLNKKPYEEIYKYFDRIPEELDVHMPGGENTAETRDRVMEFLYEIDEKYKNKKILIVTHGYITWLLSVAKQDYSKIYKKQTKEKTGFDNAEARKIDFTPIPHNRHYDADLHRPYIDEITYPCACGGEMKRIPEVFDCWFESGSMPYARLHYPFENKKEFKDNFPADFIAEGLDQTRGWFYSLLVLSVGLFGKTSHKNVIVTGMIMAEDGQKMSKSLKNYPDPIDVAEKYGADALRYYLLSSPVVHAEALNFSEKGVGEVYRKVIARLLNVLSFYQMYEDRSNKKVEVKESNNILDWWILTRLDELLEEVSVNFDSYQLDRATRPIGDFVDDLSTWYLRRSRARFKGDDVLDRDYALATTRHVLIELAKIIAPSMPFVAEHLYKEAGGKEESVHLESWSRSGKVDEKVLEEMSEVRNIVSLALEARATTGIKVRQPLASLKVKSEILRENDELLELIADEVNVKEVIVDMELKEITELNTELNTELIQEGQFRELIRNIQSLRKKTCLTPNDTVTASIKTGAEGKKLIEKFKEELMKTTLLKKVVFDDAEEGMEVVVDDLNFKVFLEK
ncbi:MAG: class I tRNA ligase family protein [Candidatus Pacebacteria bacterium]|nr:class I tRNA ligase family protein [Candidatus Paceibacterota bacterium]